MIRVIRFVLGYAIVALNAVIPVCKVKRSQSAQNNVNKQTTSLILYEFYLCPFCVRVRRMLRRLNLKIDIRDAKRVSKFRQELLAGGGRVQVPCLRIEIDGNVSWLYESKDINDYLLKRFSS